MNNFQAEMEDTAERTSSERHIANVQQQGGIFVQAVRVTRMPMIVTDATLPRNPIVFANGRSKNSRATRWTNWWGKIRIS
jgi:hypothetical protein